ETMCRALRVPDEKFRDKLYRSMREGLTTVSRELGRTPARSAVEEALIAGFSEVVGPLEEAVLPPEVADEMERVGEVLSSPEFLHWRHPSLRPGVRVNSRTTVAEGHHKAPGGLVTALVEWERGPEGGWGSRTEDGAAPRIAEAEIFGDFTLSPPEAVARLGAAVRGLPPVWGRLEEALEKCYRQAGIDAPGVRPQDVADAIIASFREVK
ncbi:MAG TPA: hypothetical protein GX513_00130, partial [Firmicutes bacterium]|nr:hypothetical protein [Bacillota bacterium]